MATTIITERSLAGLQVVVTELNTGYSRSDRYIQWYVGGSIHSRQPSSGYLGAYISQTPAFNLGYLQANTNYSVYAKIYYTDGGVYNSTNTATVTVPTAFSWTYSKTSGGDFNLTADEWNGLMSNINYVRAYKGVYTISYTYAYTGYNFTANMYNEAHPAINGLYYYMTSTGQSYISATSEVTQDDDISANSLNYIVNALNTVL